jgi:hypothetical protein
VALASANKNVRLSTFAPHAEHSAILAAIEGAGVAIDFAASPAVTTFRYLHSLARPTIRPWPIQAATSPLEATDEQILLYGTVEGSARVNGTQVVFDPQHSNPFEFPKNGCSAKELVLILNSHELRAHAATDDEATAAARIADELHVQVLVVKAGAVGARVYEGGTLAGTAPPYRTNRVYKIGSGDIFSAAYFHAWCGLGLKPLEAAEYASRSTARYCETRATDFVKPENLAHLEPLTGTPKGQIYVASPFFNLADLWLVEETCRALGEVGANPFSPFHQIGAGSPAEVAPADIEALKASTAILAIASGGDPGTLFEVGYGSSIGIPIVVLAQNARVSDMTMPDGMGCKVTDDFATAVYWAAWASSS